MKTLRRGNSLLTTLVWIALIVCLAFGLAGLTISHLSTVNFQDNHQQARLLARSVVSTAISRLMQDTDFGKAAKPSGLIAIQQDGGVGYLSFQSDLAGDKGIPYSTNNLEQTTSILGAEGHTVPKNSAYLVGVGKVGGVTQRVEALLAVPAFPYAIAASGSVEARGGLTIGALQEIPDGPIPAVGTFLPADLLANDFGSQSVFLGSDTHISGDVRAVGTIVLDPNAPADSIQVKGQLRSNSAPEKIPTINLAHYDPLINRSEYTRLTEAVYSDGQTKLGGINRREGPMTVNQGLYLDGGTLFVHGDLTVHGGLSGKGVLAVDGNVDISGQSDFNSGNGVAVLASKDFKLSGSDPQGSYFQGLVYTEGSFSADKVTLVGSLVAAGESRPVKLDQTRVFQMPAPPTPTATASPPPPPVNPGPPGQPLTVYCSTNSRKQAQFTVGPGPSGYNEVKITTIGAPVHQVNVVLSPATLAQLPSRHGPIHTFFEGAGWFADDPQDADTLLTISNAVNQITQYDLDHPSSGGVADPPPQPNGPNPAMLLMDPSSFLELSERIRVVMWKES